MYCGVGGTSVCGVGGTSVCGVRGERVSHCTKKESNRIVTTERK